jgi:hypothetical protein
MFERNRQTVRVIAYPERIPPGTEAGARIIFTFPGTYLELPVRLRRPAQSADVQISPTQVRINVPQAGFGNARIVFTNQGSAPASVRLYPPVDVLLGVEPEQFVLAPHAKQEVLLSIDAGVLGERELNTQVHCTVEGNPRPDIAVNAAVRRGANFLSGLFRKK